MKTGQEFFKRNNQLADLSKTLHINPAAFIEKVSKVREVIKKRFAAQPTGKKTCGNMPGTFCVLKIIQNSEKGVDPRTLKQMTGFNKQKVHKILYKLFKHGVIRIEGGGLYAGVKERISGSLGRMK
ncbi:MAG: hypothetical protein HY895_15815 [Deltaproteobacteria bacterium]|nr:hypothetical protein [Deltaproteobacteria bacterium]